MAKKSKKGKILKHSFIAGSAAKEKRGLLLGVFSVIVGFGLGVKIPRRKK